MVEAFMYQRKKTKIAKILTTVLLLLIATSIAQSLEITDSKLTWAGEPIIYISKNSRLPTNFEFSFNVEETENAPQKIYVDISSINNDIRINSNYKNIEINPNNCQEENRTYSCKIENLILLTDQLQAQIKITLNQDGNDKEFIETYDFKFDMTSPQVTFLGTENCHDGTCYVRAGESNKILIEMSDEQATFNRKKIAYSLGGRNGLVYNCEENTCYGYTTPDCKDGQVMYLSIIQYLGQPSQDDAGNPLKGTTTSTIVCDGQPPEITGGPNIFSSAELNAITTSDQAQVSVNATDTTSPTMKMTVKHPKKSEDTTNDCLEKADGTFSCTVALDSNNLTQGEQRISIILEDTAGNKKETTTSYRIVSTSEQKDVDLWDVKLEEITPKELEKENLIYERILYGIIDLTRTDMTAEILDIKAKASECIPVRENRTGNRGDITDMSVIQHDEEKDKVYIKFTLANYGNLQNNRYEGMNTLEYKCPLTIISKNQNTLYSNPEKDNFTIAIKLKDELNLHSRYKQELENAQRELEDLQGGMMELRQFANIAGLSCKGLGMTANGFGLAGYQTQGVYNSLLAGRPATEPALQTLELQQKSLLEGQLATEKSGSILKAVCTLFTCEDGGFLNSQLGFDFGEIMSTGHEDLITGISGLDDPHQLLDPYKSKWVAVSMACIPAIIYHQEVEAGIQCDYYQCLTDSVSGLGTSVSQCQAMKEYNECVYNWGNILSAIPITAALKETTSLISSTLRDPFSFAGTVAVAGCSTIPLIKGGGFCTGLAGVTESLRTIDMVSSMVTSFNFQHQSVCGAGSNSQTGMYNRLMLDLERAKMGSNNAPAGIEDLTKNYEVGTGSVIQCRGTMCEVMTKRGNTLEPTGLQTTVSGIDGMPSNYLESKFYLNGKEIGTGQDIVNTLGDLKAVKKGQVARENDKTTVITEEEFIKDGDFNEALINQIYNNKNAEVSATNTDRDAYFVDEKDYLNSGALQKIANNEYNFEVLKIASENGLNVNEFSQKLNNLKEAQIRKAELEKDITLYGDPTILNDDYTENDKIELYNEYAKTTSKEETIQLLRKTNQLPLDEKEAKKIIDQITEDGGGESIYDTSEDLNSFLESEYYYGNLKNSWRTITNTMRAFRGFSNLFGGEGIFGVKFGEDTIFNKAATALKTISEPEKAFCANNVDQLADETGGVILGTTGSGNSAPGANIGGRKAGPIQPVDEKPYYEYWISGGVAGPKKAGLSFKIMLYGDGTEDITEKVTGERTPQVGVGSAIYFGGATGTYYFTSDKDYDRVCIDFGMSGYALESYFDKVTGLSDGKFCNKFIGE